MIQYKENKNTLTTPFENPMVIFKKLAVAVHPDGLFQLSAGEIFYLD